MNERGQRPPRSQALVDAIEAEQSAPFVGTVWRVVTDGFDVLHPGRSGGRWDDGSFDVLYTSSERDGALAEAWFHASKGLPVIPSKIAKRLYKLEVELSRVLDLSADGKLAALGVNMARYGQLAYVDREDEYPTLQQIAETAHFFGYEAIIVPNARWPACNVVVFTEVASRQSITIAQDEVVDLALWYEGVGRTQAKR